MADNRVKVDVGIGLVLFCLTVGALGLLVGLVAKDRDVPAAVARSPGLFWVAGWKTDMALALHYIERTREVTREIKCRERETRACFVCSQRGLESGLERLRGDASDAGAASPPDETEGTAL